MTSLDWIKQIDEALLELEERPQFGGPEFFWEEFENRLRETFGIEDLNINHQALGWKLKEEFLSDEKNELIILPIYWAQLSSPVYFVTSLQEVQRLMTLCLDGQSTASYFYDKGYSAAFFEYFGAEILRTLMDMEFASPLSARLGKMVDSDEMNFKEPCFLIEISLSSRENPFWGRVLIPDSFRKEWKAFFFKREGGLAYGEKSRLSVELGLEIGYIQLTYKEWKKVRKGDFIVLDRCSYDPVKKQGRGLLTLKNKLLFRFRFKDEQIEIINYPVSEEAAKMIDDDENSSWFDEDEIDFPEIEEEEKEEISSERQNQVSPADLPIRFSVEAAHITMSVQELMDLAPGSVLDLQVSPEQGVDLVANGKKIGRGELLRVGEMLGVRILSL